MTSVAVLHRESILERLAKGEYLKDIANDLGVRSSALSQVLNTDPEYIAAREQGMSERLDNAHSLLAEITERRDIPLDHASDYLNLVRIREAGLKRLEWRAEREFANRWGSAKINLNVINNVSMSDVLSDVAGELLEHVTDS